MSDIVESLAEDPFDAIVDAPFDAALSERYLIYAMSTITARSLPDLRDGLKPVHRRLLWAMRLLKLDPASGYKMRPHRRRRNGQIPSPWRSIRL